MLLRFVVEPEKKVSVVYDVDVAVAGAGVSGVFAAIAAARNGADTVLIDRFGTVGGNMGPGLIAGGSLTGWPIKHMLGPGLGGFAGIPKEFIERHAALGGGSIPPYSQNQYLRDSNVASYVSLKMLEESGVKLILSSYVADPILEGKLARGIFVENKSGRQAIRAKVVIDATGEADVARRAGAPIIYPKTSYHETDGHAPTGMGLFFALGGVDWAEYESYKGDQQKPSEEDVGWSKDTLGFVPPGHLLPLVRKAWESGEYRIVQEIDGLGSVRSGELARMHGGDGLAWGRIGPERREEISAGDGLHISKLEAKVRMYIFETAQFWKRNVPGFGNSYLLCVAPFFGARGGPCIEGEYTVTMDDVKAGRRFPDVLFIFDHIRPGGAYVGNWTDFPYRAMLPRKVDGLLAVGRSASCIPDTLLRGRMMVMHMGQAGGTAAALAVKNRVAPRELDVKELQGTLLEAGFYLGDRSRLRELGLG